MSELNGSFALKREVGPGGRIRPGGQESRAWGGVCPGLPCLQGLVQPAHPRSKRFHKFAYVAVHMAAREQEAFAPRPPPLSDESARHYSPQSPCELRWVG